MLVLDDNEQPVKGDDGEDLRAPCAILQAGGEGHPCKREPQLERYRAKGWPCPRPPLDPRDEHVANIAAAITDPVGQSGCGSANDDLWAWATRYMTLRERVRFRHLVAFYANEYQRLSLKHMEEEKDNGEGTEN